MVPRGVLKQGKGELPSSRSLLPLSYGCPSLSPSLPLSPSLLPLSASSSSLVTRHSLAPSLSRSNSTRPPPTIHAHVHSSTNIVPHPHPCLPTLHPLDARDFTSLTASSCVVLLFCFSPAARGHRNHTRSGGASRHHPATQYGKAAGKDHKGQLVYSTRWVTR